MLCVARGFFSEGFSLRQPSSHVHVHVHVHVHEDLSEDPGLTTYFFPGRDGVGGWDIQMSRRRRRRRRRDPPNGRGSPMLKTGLQTYFLDFPVDD